MAFNAAECTRGELTIANQPSVECDPGSRCTYCQYARYGFRDASGGKGRNRSDADSVILKTPQHKPSACGGWMIDIGDEGSYRSPYA